MPRRSNWEPGNVFEITLPRGGLAYGMVSGSKDVVFFDFQATKRPMIADILRLPVAFRIWVMRSSIREGGWTLIGFASVPEKLRTPTTYYKFDSIARQYALYRGDGTEEPTNREQCIGLESASVWSAVHVESRLEDHFAKKPNKWVESLSAVNRW